MIQVPDAFLRAVVDFPLPPAGQYATGLVFLPDDDAGEALARRVVEKYALVEGADVLGWRDVPTDPSGLGETALVAMPRIRQLFLAAHRLTDSPAGPAGSALTGLDLDRVAFCVRKQAERETAERGAPAYFPSLSGADHGLEGHAHPGPAAGVLPGADRLAGGQRDRAGALALLHQHLPVLAAGPPVPVHRAQRRDQHDPRQPELDAGTRIDAQRRFLSRSGPAGTCRATSAGSSRSARPAASDSANFDEVLELLHLAGRSLPHAVLMMIPEAWENDPEMRADKRAFYRFHASLIEPWDGPASVAFTDGEIVGAVLDRNGLRPGRWWRTADGLVVLGSEAGVLDLDPATVVAKGRLQPGKMFLVDTVNRPDRLRRRDQDGAGRRAAVRRLAARRPDRPGRPAAA